MMLTPCWPRAGPTGGAGFAWAAVICSLIWVRTFLATGSYHLSLFAEASTRAGLQAFHLQEVELHGGLAPEDADHDLELAALRVDLVDHPVEIRERPVDDLDLLADMEGDLADLLRFLGLGLAALEDPVHFLVRHRHRPVAGPDEAGDARDVVDQVQHLLVHLELHEHIAGEELAVHLDLLPLLHLGHFFHGDQHLTEAVLQALQLHGLLDALLHLVLVPRVGVHHVPFAVRVRDRHARVGPARRGFGLHLLLFLAHGPVGPRSLVPGLWETDALR